MRTRFEVVLADSGGAAALRAAGEAALDEVDRCEAQLSAFRDDSELFRINAQALDGQPVAVDMRVLIFLSRAQLLCEWTDGAFDPAAGALLACWNLAAMADGAAGAIPDAAAIAAALAAGDMRTCVELDPRTASVAFTHPDVRLDPGAVGKGYALERAAEILAESGMRSALLHGGTSTVCALGRPPDQSAWTVAVRHPLAGDRHLATASLADTSLSVSAVHGKSFTIAGRRHGHVIDPRSGGPVQGNLLAAVIHPSAMVSDALSTALLVMGREGAPLLAERFPDASFLLASDGRAGDVDVHTSGVGFTATDAVPTGATAKERYAS